MKADTVLQLTDHLEVTLHGTHGTTVRRPGGRSIDVGPHGIAVLQAFREPRSLQSALDDLAARSASLVALVEAVSLISRLRAAELLVAPAATRPTGTPAGFAAQSAHIALLDDRVRTSAFLSAIAATIRPEDVVVDLGTGTGILAIAAARAGARHVYAIEATAIADAAAGMFAASGVGDRISLVRGWSTAIELPELADVLITETLGDGPWDEGFIHFIVDARRRLLRPGARLIPSRIRLLAQPVCVPPAWRQRLQFTDDGVRRWSEWYGLNFAPLAAVHGPGPLTATFRAREVDDWRRPAEAVMVAEFDAQGASMSPTGGSVSARCSEDATVDGVLLAWEAELAAGVSVATLPSGAAANSWRVSLLMSRTPCRVHRGDRLSVSVTFGSPPVLSLKVTG